MDKTKNKIKLNGTWRMSGHDENNNKISVLGTVPGTVYSVLAENNMLPGGGENDIFFGNNADKAAWIENEEWIFERDFDFCFTDKVKKVEIELNGLDTYCEISINDSVIGSCNNANLCYTFDISEYIKNGKNTIKIKFLPPVEQDSRFIQRDYRGAFSGQRMYTRRMQCTYGWDWVNRFVDMGIWRDVTIYINRYVKIDCLNARLNGITPKGAVMELYLKGRHDKKFFDGAFKDRSYHFETSPMVCFTVNDPDGKEIYKQEMLFREEVITDYVTVENPKLWFPAGYGESYLYTLTAEVKDDCGRVITEKTVQFGIRDISVVEKLDEKDSEAYKTAEKMFELMVDKSAGENEFASFDLYINNVRIICKGANWVPANPFPGNVSADKYKNLIRLAKDGNMNMLRVWGGGCFEDEEFYNLCDRYGIMVQQDFLMACGNYPYSDDFIEDPTEDEALFVENLRNETEQNVQRLVSHPSIVWWNGDNENQSAGNLNLINNARRISNEVTAPILRKYDGKRRFFPSTPWGGSCNNSPARGLCHYTGYLHKYSDFIENTDMTGYVEFFGSFIARFANETPVLSCPTESTVKKFLPPEEMTAESFDGYIYHTKNHPDERYKNFGLFNHIDTGAKKLFGDFKNGSDRIYKMGILGYEWTRSLMEAIRRREDYTSGNIFWMYNDCWPALGWSMVDYYGTPKAAYYAMKRTSAEVTASVACEDSRVVINISNDGIEPKDARVKLNLVSGEGVLYSEEMTAQIAAGGLVKLTPKNMEKFILGDNKQGAVIVCDVMCGGGQDRAFYSAVTPSKLNLSRANVIMERKDKKIKLKTDKLAIFVWLDGDYVFSDNCFMLLPGEEKEIAVEESFEHSSDNISLHWLNS